MTAIRAGKTCLLSSMSNILLGRGAQVDEELIFLLGRGNRIDYRFSETDGQPAVFLGHHSLDIVARFCELLGSPHSFVEGESPEPLSELRRQLAGGNPVLIWVNMARLPYLQMKPPENAIHAVTVTAEHDGVLCIHDCYAPLGLYSDKVATHVMEVPFSEFSAWQGSGYCRHLVDFNHLQSRIDRPRIELLTDGVRWACQDFLHGTPQAPATLEVLQCLAGDLAVLHERYPGHAHAQVYSALAYNLRYFGMLWTRDCMANALSELGPAIGSARLPGLAQELRECVRRWKLVMLGFLKLPLSRKPEQQVDSLQRKMREILDVERGIYRAMELAI